MYEVVITPHAEREVKRLDRLHQHPEHVDAFWDYYLVQLEKLGYERIAEKYDKDWKQTIAPFKLKTKKGKTHTQVRWSENSLVKQAKDLGFEDLLKDCYYLPNLFIHNSPAEILFSLKTESDGTISPVDRGGEEEKRFADVAFFHGYLLVLKSLELVIDHYGWEEDKAIVEEAAGELAVRIRLMHDGESD